MSNVAVGTCGICGGPVTVPSPWLGVIPPTPVCQRCGAEAAQGHGPVMPMKQGSGYRASWDDKPNRD